MNWKSPFIFYRYVLGMLLHNYFLRYPIIPVFIGALFSLGIVFFSDDFLGLPFPGKQREEQNSWMFFRFFADIITDEHKKWGKSGEDWSPVVLQEWKGDSTTALNHVILNNGFEIASVLMDPGYWHKDRVSLPVKVGTYNRVLGKTVGDSVSIVVSTEGMDSLSFFLPGPHLRGRISREAESRTGAFIGMLNGRQYAAHFGVRGEGDAGFNLYLCLDDPDYLTPFQNQELATLLVVGSKAGSQNMWVSKIQVRVFPDLGGIQKILQQTVLILVVLFGFLWGVVVLISRSRDATVVPVPDHILAHGFIIGAGQAYAGEKGIFLKSPIAARNAVMINTNGVAPSHPAPNDGVRGAWVLLVIGMSYLLFWLYCWWSEGPASLIKILGLGAGEAILCYGFAFLTWQGNVAQWGLTDMGPSFFIFYAPKKKGILPAWLLINALLLAIWFPWWMALTVVLLGAFPLVVYGWNTLIILDVPPTDCYVVL